MAMDLSLQPPQRLPCVDSDANLSHATQVRALIRGHLEQVAHSLETSIIAELANMEVLQDARSRELQDENQRLRSELDAKRASSLDSVGTNARTEPADGFDAGDPEMSRGVSEPKTPMRKTVTFSDKASRMVSIFRELDPDMTGVIKIFNFTEKLRHEVHNDDVHHLDDMQLLIEALRKHHPEMFRALGHDEMSYEVFKKIMLDEDLKSVGSQHFRIVNALRRACLRDVTAGAVAKAADVRREDLIVDNGFASDRLWWLEPTVAIVIIINAASIGLSQDIEPDSKLWVVLEVVCTCFFMCELVLKLCVQGVLTHLFGAGWQWNLFDCTLVIVAFFDMVVMIAEAVYEDDSDLPFALHDLTVLRTARLLRVARLARLLNLKYMKEFILMANGLIGGLRTLFWAFALLMSLLYAGSIFCHQAIAQWRTKHMDCGQLKFNKCSKFERDLFMNYEPMFSTLFKTWFTVYRCVTGDCNCPNGIPLAPVLLETLGWSAVLVYVGCSVFVIYGVFNLIMAVFVENTLESAKNDKQKQQSQRQQEHVHVAQKLQKVVDLIVGHAKKPGKTSADGLLKYLPKNSLLVSAAEAEVLAADAEVVLPMNFAVTRPLFEEALADADIEELFEDLDISMTNKSRFFEVLDSNGNGQLDIHEMVDGIMRLRGPADKGDIVSTSLMLRALQKSFADMQRSIDQLQRKLTARHSYSSRAQRTSVGSVGSVGGTPAPSSFASENGSQYHFEALTPGGATGNTAMTSQPFGSISQDTPTGDALAM